MKNFFKEFAKFIKRGNVLDLSVAVIIGGAFNKIVTSLTNSIIMPIITFFVGENSLDGMAIVLRKATDPEGTDLLLKYGEFLQAIIDFLLIALIVFLIVRIVTRVSRELDYNNRMKEAVQEKYDKNEALSSREAKWVARMQKDHPEMVPVRKEDVVPAEPAPAAPTEAELLQSILEELKKQNAANAAEKKD
ncbi:MAG: large conductance mechanosensitive channel protein MscL [Candidatus Borkfalkiaceae bacterium]|nr:large conductance mechanosensitive channel protein MscL [Christensenellaceae bacterium]